MKTSLFSLQNRQLCWSKITSFQHFFPIVINGSISSNSLPLLSSTSLVSFPRNLHHSSCYNGNHEIDSGENSALNIKKNARATNNCTTRRFYSTKFNGNFNRFVSKCANGDNINKYLSQNLFALKHQQEKHQMVRKFYSTSFSPSRVQFASIPSFFINGVKNLNKGSLVTDGEGLKNDLNVSVNDVTGISQPEGKVDNICQISSIFKRNKPFLARNRGPPSVFEGSGSGSLWPGGSAGGKTGDVSSYFGGGSSDGGGDVLTPAVKEHLIRVYNLLALGVGAASLGASAMILTPIGKLIPFWLPLFGGFVPLLWLMFKPPANPTARMALYFTFTVLEGMALAPIIKMTATAGVLGTALVLTGAVFLGFSAAAFLAPRASMLALQGPLFGMLIGLVAISLLNMFYPTAFAHSIILYGGLALFSVFVAVDTQAMVERARCGVSDPTMDALQMFLNVVNIFVRIAEILRGMSQ